MANRSITAASVLPSAAATIQRLTAGAAITAGQVLYKDPTTGNAFLASASAGTIQTPIGIAVNNAAIGQPVNFVALDPAFQPGYATSVGETTYLSETAGAICSLSDLTTGDQPVILLLGTGSATASLSIIPAGVKK
jgi:hypothetical protein